MQHLAHAMDRLHLALEVTQRKKSYRKIKEWRYWGKQLARQIHDKTNSAYGGWAEWTPDYEEEGHHLHSLMSEQLLWFIAFCASRGTACFTEKEKCQHDVKEILGNAKTSEELPSFEIPNYDRAIHNIKSAIDFVRLHGTHTSTWCGVSDAIASLTIEYFQTDRDRLTFVPGSACMDITGGERKRIAFSDEFEKHVQMRSLLLDTYESTYNPEEAAMEEEVAMEEKEAAIYVGIDLRNEDVPLYGVKKFMQRLLCGDDYERQAILYDSEFMEKAKNGILLKICEHQNNFLLTSNKGRMTFTVHRLTEHRMSPQAFIYNEIGGEAWKEIVNWLFKKAAMEEKEAAMEEESYDDVLGFWDDLTEGDDEVAMEEKEAAMKKMEDGVGINIVREIISSAIELKYYRYKRPHKL